MIRFFIDSWIRERTAPEFYFMEKCEKPRLIGQQKSLICKYAASLTKSMQNYMIDVYVHADLRIHY